MTNNEEQFNTVETAEPEQSQVLAEEQTPTSTDEHTVADESAVKTRQRKRIDTILNISIWVAIAVLIVMVFLRLFVFTNIEIKHQSMSDTYNDGDVVVVNKLAAIKRGEVVVFYTKDVDNKWKAMFATGDDVKENGKYEKYIKRVVAVAGDKMWAEPTGEDDMYRIIIETPDGTRLHEDYYKRGKTQISERLICNNSDSALTLLGEYLEGTTEDNPLVISEGHFFAMGDNRNNSVDSRRLGEIPVSRLFGVVVN